MRPLTDYDLYYTLSPEGETMPVNDAREWAVAFEKSSNWHICRTEISSMFGIFVSTIFLGINHNAFSEGPPLLFETMIFGGRCHNYQERCSTLQEAYAMHRKALCYLAYSYSIEMFVDGLYWLWGKVQSGS